MGQHQMVVGQRQPQLSLKPREVRGEASGAPGSAPITLTLSQVVAQEAALLQAFVQVCSSEDGLIGSGVMDAGESDWSKHHNSLDLLYLST
jgi:hypothetical protein